MADPRCPYFRKCGGCSFQHIDYSVQLERKKKKIAEAINFPDIQVFSGKEYFYRQRMDMIFHPEGLGFREKGAWHKTVNVERCVISNENLNELILEVRNFLKDVDVFDVRENRKIFRYAVIRTPPNDSSISIVINKDSPHIKEAEQKIREFAKITTARNVLITFVPPNRDMSVSEEFSVIKGTEMLREQYLGKIFWYPIQGFFQNNHIIAEQMHAYCHSLLEKAKVEDGYLLDLYGGVGTFAIINAELFREATIVESSEQAIMAAEKNRQENKASNVEPVLLDSKYLRRIELSKPLFVVVNPPRSGNHSKAIKRLNELRPEKLIYVSCNVHQLVQDLAKLENHKIKSAALFDLFPQTPHIESVVELDPLSRF